MRLDLANTLITDLDIDDAAFMSNAVHQLVASITWWGSEHDDTRFGPL